MIAPGAKFVLERRRKPHLGARLGNVHVEQQNALDTETGNDDQTVIAALGAP